MVGMELQRTSSQCLASLFLNHEKETERKVKEQNKERFDLIFKRLCFFKSFVLWDKTS